jgi:hypothetical protein
MSDTDTGAERRHEPRIEALNLVRAAEYSDIGLKLEDAVGRTLDLSHDGMRLELDHCLPLRSRVWLSLALGNQLLDLHGRIKFLREIDSTKCEMGIEFEDVRPEQYEALEEYLQLRSE